jgi:hypothetical protein
VVEVDCCKQRQVANRGSTMKKTPEIDVTEGSRLRSETARGLVQRVEQLLPLVGDVSLATHLALLLRDLARCYKLLNDHPSETNFLSIVALVEMALTGPKLRRFDRAYLEAIRQALEIGCRESRVRAEDVESVREQFRQKQIDTVPRIDLASLKPEDLTDDDE